MSALMPRQVVLLLAVLPLTGSTGCDRPSKSAGDRGEETSVAVAALPGEEMDVPLPAVRLADLDGRNRPLRAQSDEVTLINFWATWCLPCLKELPELVALHEGLRGRGLHVVGIAIDSGDPADIHVFAEEHAMDYTILTARQSWTRKHFGVFGLPITLVVDREGRIRRRLIGPQTGVQFRAAIRPFL